MNNTLLLSIAVSVLPQLALLFVALLLIYKIYISIRTKFNVAVNCWFCNRNAKVPYLEANCWTCPHCEQYNGFTKDGDYNREIFAQLDCSASASNSTTSNNCLDYSGRSSSELFGRRQRPSPPRNGFCNGCNEAQRLKVEKLAQFEPKNESHFETELKVYKAQLEEQYRLCATCDRHLNKVLREKKKMVLGSKFLDFIIKGAETLKQPHFTQIRHAQQQLWKRRLVLLITLLTAVNVCCLLNTLPAFLTRDTFTRWFGAPVGQHIFIAVSHVVTLGRVLSAYFDAFTQYGTVLKVQLFFRTLLMMVLYSMGLKWPQVAGFNFVSLFVLACPFAILALAFAHNIADAFKLTRYTLLLVLWSVFAGGLVGDQTLLSPEVLMLLASLVTLLLTITTTSETSPKLHDTSATSFHKIYSEDYLSDDETISMLSQQLNCSAASVRSSHSAVTQRGGGGGGGTNYRAAASPAFNTSFNNHARHAYLPAKSPITSSALSLNQLPPHHPHAGSTQRGAQLSPNASFHSFCLDDSQSSYAPASSLMYNVPLSQFGSGFDVSRSHRERPQAALFGRSGNFSAAAAAAANSSFGHTSYADSHAPSFYSAANSPFAVAASAAAPLHSPFSVSSNAIYQQQKRASTLLTPSRFSTNCLPAAAAAAASPSSAAATSWLSGGYFNQRQSLAGTYRNDLTAIDENLSRASSQSSGFESQHGGAGGLGGGGGGGRLNAAEESRENSFCAEDSSHDLLQRTFLAQDKTFQPIPTQNGSSSNSAFSPLIRPPPNSNLAQPLTVNCSDAASWKSPASLLMRRPAKGSRDSFNLRRINEELPTYKRGDLLKKWTQSQQATIS